MSSTRIFKILTDEAEPNVTTRVKSNTGPEFIVFIDRLSLPVLPERDVLNKGLDSLYSTMMLSNDGAWSEKFTELLCEFTGRKHCILFSSASTAIDNLLFYYRDRVVSACPYTWVTSNGSVNRHLQRVHWFDVLADSPIADFNALIHSNAWESTEVVFSTHVYGASAQPNVLDDLERSGKIILFDGAHALGVTLESQSLLKKGAASVVSFHPTKGVTACEGGAILTDNAKIASDLTHLSRPINMDGGFHPYSTNTRMSELNAMFGYYSIVGLNNAINVRRRLWNEYQKNLGSLLFDQTANCVNSNYLYAIVRGPSTESIERMETALKTTRIAHRRYFNDLGVSENIVGSQKNIKNWLSKTLAVPLHHRLTTNEVKQISDVILSAV